MGTLKNQDRKKMRAQEICSYRTKTLCHNHCLRLKNVYAKERNSGTQTVTKFQYMK